MLQATLSLPLLALHYNLHILLLLLTSFLLENFEDLFQCGTQQTNENWPQEVLDLNADISVEEGDAEDKYAEIDCGVYEGRSQEFLGKSRWNLERRAVATATGLGGRRAADGGFRLGLGVRAVASHPNKGRNLEDVDARAVL